MTNSAKLVAALTSVDWNANVRSFCGDAHAADGIAAANFRIASWARQFENIENGNPAICFIREMQVAAQMVATNTALCAYKSAAAAMRTIAETALYFTYFRSHPAELATLARSSDWYVSKDEILEFHKTHTVGFADLQHKLGFLSRFKPWYSKVSAIVHGQLPGIWHSQTSIATIKVDKTIEGELLAAYQECVEIVDYLFFCTAGRELWNTFSPEAKRVLLHGVPGATKTLLGLDSA